METAAAHTLTVARTARYYVLGQPDAPEVWFVLHGYGQQARYFVRPFRVHAGAARCIVAPEALSRFYLDKGYERIGASWMTREARDAEIADTVAYLDAVAAPFAATGQRCCVLGFSQGAAAACRWAAYGSTRFHRVALWGGEVPHDLDLVHYGAHLAGLTLAWGDADAFATAARMASTKARLQEAAVPYHTLRFAGEHRLYAEPLARLLNDA